MALYCTLHDNEKLHSYFDRILKLFIKLKKFLPHALTIKVLIFRLRRNLVFKFREKPKMR